MSNQQARVPGVAKSITVFGACVIAAIAVGLTVVATRTLVTPPQSADPLLVALMRNAVACGFLVVAMLFWPSQTSTRSTRRSIAWDLTAIVAIGAPGYCIFPVLFTISLQYAGASQGSLLLAAVPTLTLAVAASLGRETMSWTRLISCVVAASGVCIALGVGFGSLGNISAVGLAAMAGAAIATSTFNVLIAPFSARYGALLTILIAMISGTVFLAAIVLLSGRPLMLKLDTSGWSAMLFLGFAAGLGNLLWGFALGRLGPSRVAVFATLNPVAAAIGGWVVLQEPLTSKTIVGFVLVTVAIFMMNRPNRGTRHDKLAAARGQSEA